MSARIIRRKSSSIKKEKPLKKHPIDRFARHYVLATAVFALTVASLATAGGVASIADAAVTSVVAELNSRSQLAAVAAASPCQIVATTTATTDRKIQLKMSGCVGVRFFQVAESPNFTEEAGVTVALSNVATDLTSADVSVTYANATTTGTPIPYSIPSEQRTVKALAVLYQHEDANGNTAGTANYETPTWLKRVVFGDEIVSYDGHSQHNSYADHIYQSTNGRVLLTGETYPAIVHIPLEKFRNFYSGAPDPDVKSEVIAAITRDNPNFFANKSFDYYFFLSSDMTEVTYPGWQVNVDNVVYPIPYQQGKSIFSSTLEEVRTPVSSSVIVTRYNPASVQGVWLESDTTRTGINYFSGGSIKPYRSVFLPYIQLGTALPTPTPRVVVRYTVQDFNGQGRIATSSLNIWDFQNAHNFFHENYHQLSALPAFQFSLKTRIGDAYKLPTTNAIDGYDLMDTNAMLATDPISGVIRVSAPLLHAFNKVSMGYVTPFTLAYGKNESNIHLMRAEFTNATQVQQNITAIKIPLHPKGDPGLATKREGGNDIGTNLGTRQFGGDEYILLELRSQAPLPNNYFNFDNALRSQGVVLYHVIAQSPYGTSVHADDVDEIIDATPPSLGGYSNTPSSPALLGQASGVFQLSLPVIWQDKDPQLDTQTFDYLLSPGRGSKTLYARFVDSNGTLLGTDTRVITLNDDKKAADRMPQLTLSLNSIGSQRYLLATYTAPNGLTSVAPLVFYMDSTKLREVSIPRSRTSGSENYILTSAQLAAPHTFKVVFTDGAMLSVIKTIAYTPTGTPPVVPPPDTTAPSTPANLTGSAVSSSQINLSWAASTDNVGVVGYKLLRNGVLIATPVSTSFLNTTVSPGTTYTYTVAAVDAAGNTSLQSPSISITTPAPPDTTLPSTALTAPASGATISGNVILAASASDNVGVARVEFYIDGALRSTNTASPYTYSWVTTAVVNGSHTLQTKAYDAAGNVGSSAVVAVTVSNIVAPPPSDKTAPTSPSNLSGSAPSSTQIDLSWGASSDAVGVVGYKVYRGGKQIATTTATSYSNASLAQSTVYYYSVYAFDAAANVSGPSNTVYVVTPKTPDTTVPAVTITSPVNGATITSIVYAVAAASDNVGVTKVEFYRDGALVDTYTAPAPGIASSNFTWAWNTTASTKGSHTLQAKTYDASGNSSASQIIAVTVQ